MPKKLSPFLVLGATATVALTTPIVQAAQTITLSQAANQANINLKPNQGVYIQLPSKLPIYRFAIDDGSVLSLGDAFTPGTSIIRVVGKAAGTTGLGLIVQDGSQLQTLNFTVKVGSKGSQGTIQITDEAYLEASAQTPYPVDKVRTGLNFANVRGRIPAGSPLDVAVKKWIKAVQAGQGGTDALEALSLSGDVLERLANLGRTTVTRSKPIPAKETVTASRRGASAQPGLQARVTSLEQQIQALREKDTETPQATQKTEPKAKPQNDKEVNPTPPPTPSIEGMTPIEIAHAIKAGLPRYPNKYPYRSKEYDQVNTAVILLKRGNSLETASRHSGVDPQTLRILAGEPPRKVSERAAR